MIAVVFDPLICKSSWWWLIAECWGFLPFVALPLACVAAVAVRRLRRLA